MLTAKPLRKPDRVAMMHLDQLLDEALQETFPASDPIAVAIELETVPARSKLTRLRRSRAAPRSVE